MNGDDLQTAFTRLTLTQAQGEALADLVDAVRATNPETHVSDGHKHCAECSLRMPCDQSLLAAALAKVDEA